MCLDNCFSGARLWEGFVPLQWFLMARFGAIRAAWSCHYQMLLPGLLGWEVLGICCLGWTLAALGLGPKAEYHCRILVLPHWLQVFGQEPGTFLLLLLGFSSLVRLYWPFFQRWPCHKAPDLAQQVPQAPVSLGNNGYEMFCRSLSSLQEIWQCVTQKAALMGSPALC